MALEAMVRNFIDLADEGIRRLLRVTRKGIRRESLAEYALLPRDAGSPAWISPNSFDVQSDTGFRRAKFIPRFDAKFENGIISNSLKGGLSFSSSAEGEISHPASGTGEMPAQFPIPGLLIEEEVKTSYNHAPTNDDKRI